MDGRVTGRLDNRLDVYRVNQAAVPQVAGQVIPEAAFSRADYQHMILEPMYQAIAPRDPRQILQEEWLNSRGAIARFDRNAIEIRLLDVQECPAADLAIQQLVVAVLRELVAEHQTGFAQQCRWHQDRLAGIFTQVLDSGPETLLDDPAFVRLFGVDAEAIKVGELWSVLAQRLIPVDSTLWPVLETILTQGPLARRLSAALGASPDPDRLAAVYRELCDCLQTGELFRG
jgi:carboxylate-amine ligase